MESLVRPTAIPATRPPATPCQFPQRLTRRVGLRRPPSTPAARWRLLSPGDPWRSPPWKLNSRGQQCGGLRGAPPPPRPRRSAFNVTAKCKSTFICRAGARLCDKQADGRREAVDVVILTNGPGEVATWVKPVIAKLRGTAQDDAIDMRISVVLSPCPHASGGELRLLQSFEEIDRCQGPEGFFSLLLLGRTPDGWGWRKKGVCIFLGGDQFFTLVLGWRLGYKTLVYAEDAARWPGFVDGYMLRSQEILLNVPQWARSRCQVVGDLFVDAVENSPSSRVSRVSHQSEAQDRNAAVPVVGLLPGSKDAKLAIGVPYFMAVADHLHQLLGGQVNFLLPLAPTVTIPELERHANAASNPLISRFHWASGHVVKHQNQGKKEAGAAVAATTTSRKIHRENSSEEESTGKNLVEQFNKAEEESRQLSLSLVTERGVVIEIRQEFPPYALYQGCAICLTTVGTNTAELGTLCVPMLVVLPTYFLETFRGATGGLLGLLSALPGQAGAAMAHLVNLFILNTAGFISWPNSYDVKAPGLRCSLKACNFAFKLPPPSCRFPSGDHVLMVPVIPQWAGEEIVPELIGEIEPTEVARVAAEYLQLPADGLQVMRTRLLELQRERSHHGSEAVAEATAGPADSIALAVQQLLQRYEAGTLPSS